MFRLHRVCSEIIFILEIYKWLSEGPQYFYIEIARGTAASMHIMYTSKKKLGSLNVSLI